MFVFLINIRLNFSYLFLKGFFLEYSKKYAIEGGEKRRTNREGRERKQEGRKEGRRKGTFCALCARSFCNFVIVFSFSISLCFLSSFLCLRASLRSSLLRSIVLLEKKIIDIKEVVNNRYVRFVIFIVNTRSRRGS